MEFKEVVGRRRSIRFFLPWRPVEREKVQTVLEAVLLAPRIMGVHFLRLVVVYRDSLSPEDLEALKTPTTTAQLDMAPVYLFFFADLNALARATDGHYLKEMIEVGALPPSHGWTPRYVDEVVIPRVYQAILNDPDRVPLMIRRPEGPQPGPSYPVRLLNLANTALGVAQAHALLCAFALGLGAMLTGVSTPAARRILGIPDHWLPASPMLLGYPAESPGAGGQRPREPFEEDFFEGRYGIPFRREQAVVEELKAAKMIQDPAPLPWRKAELRALAKMFGLPM